LKDLPTIISPPGDSRGTSLTNLQDLVIKTEKKRTKRGIERTARKSTERIEEALKSPE